MTSTSPRTLAAYVRHAEALAAHRKGAKAERDAMRALAVKAAATGTTEVELARLGGVDRMTVREWLGKSPSAFHPKPRPKA
jgi:hypothetical protein